MQIKILCHIVSSFLEFCLNAQYIYKSSFHFCLFLMSLPSRGAWIEKSCQRRGHLQNRHKGDNHYDH